MQSDSYDVVIVGGGISGFAAAVGAAENARVCLIDKGKFIGGDSTQANVGTFCGLYYRTESEHHRFAGYPFTLRLLQKLQSRSEFSRPMNHQGLPILPYDPHVLHEVMDAWLRQIRVDVMPAASVTSVEMRGQGIRALTLDGERRLSMKAVVDATGNGAIAEMAGEDMIRESSYQSAAQVFRLAGIPSGEAFSLSLAITKAMLTGGEAFPDSYRGLSVVPGSMHSGQVDLKLPLPHTVSDNENSIAYISADMQQAIPSLVAWLRDHVQFLSTVSLKQIFPRVGVRVRQRPRGKQLLTEADVMTVKKQPDGIAVGTWPIETWGYDGKVSMQYFEMDKGYDIAPGCLRAKNATNLYYAGKCISATTTAIASARVMGTCLQTGYAAGKLAADDSARTLQLLRHELIR